MAFITNIRSDILIRIFEGELGREKHLADIDDYEWVSHPNKGELITTDAIDGRETWEIINILHDYTINEMNIFVKRYIWPDER